MMRPDNALPAVYLCAEPVDMRKQINGLAALVEETLCLDPFSEQLFVFINKRRDRVKCLYWESSGFVLWLKRLERERFYWPRAHGKRVISLSAQELNWLLDGHNLALWRPHRRLRYTHVT